MDMPKNRFKAALKAGRHQLGIWNSIGGNTVAEMLAGAGFDWVLIDTEHAPVEAVEVMAALQAVGQYPEVSAIVRPVVNDTALIKRYLDMGAQSLLIPYVQSADEARAAVAAVRYPPQGVRGVAGMMRAARYGRIEGYTKQASDGICLLVQVETKAAVERLEEIATVDGVDGVFIGPADLAASLGFPGETGHPEVVATIEDTLSRLKALGVPSGILSFDTEFSRRCMDLGTAFTAVGLDLALLVQEVDALRARFDR